MKQIGEVKDYFSHVEVAAVKLSGVLKLGDKIKIIGGNTDFEQIIESMQINKQAVEKAKKGDEVGIKITEKARKGYKVYKI